MIELLLPIAQPGTTKNTKTGDWRTFRPVLDSDNCISCGICKMYCPESAVSGGEKKQLPKIDYDFCKGCGICAEECPKKAIDMKDESK